ncbi:hypothetical protein ABID21_000275 [Pseudorhizobium tarimense]|uniref:Uncharacterized protein n=1 Tax=Pseudorhizobium tarimense TaxID=1079109 RepID=A0ABV2H0X3_9HYPH
MILVPQYVAYPSDLLPLDLRLGGQELVRNTSTCVGNDLDGSFNSKPGYPVRLVFLNGSVSNRMLDYSDGFEHLGDEMVDLFDHQKT